VTRSGACPSGATPTGGRDGGREDQDPLLDELEDGPWPSFVKEIKRAGEKSPVCEDLLGQLELSYKEKKGHWKHGGIVGVLGYGGGDRPLQRRARPVSQRRALPHASREPAVRCSTRATPCARSVTSGTHGSGLTNMHGATGDIIFLGTKTDELEPTFKELTAAGFDLGGSGSSMRTPSCCVARRAASGPATTRWPSATT